MENKICEIRGSMEFTTVNDTSQSNIVFTWVKTVKKKLLETFNEEDLDTLQFLQQNIHEEFESLLSTKDKLRCEALYRILSDFYLHFFWRIDWNADSHMKYCCVHILYYMICIALILSHGDLTSQWLNKVLTIVKSFPGDLYLMFDAFLLIQNMRKKYHEAYALILKLILCQECIENPSDAESFAKVMLLFRRLKFLSNDKAKRSAISLFAYKVKCPPDFMKWKSSLNIQNFSNIKCDDATKELLSKNLNPSTIKKLFKILFEAKYIEKLVNPNKTENTTSNKSETLKQSIFQMKKTKLSKPSLSKRHLDSNDKIIKKVKYEEIDRNPQLCKTMNLNSVETSNELKEQTNDKKEYSCSSQSPNNLHHWKKDEASEQYSLFPHHSIGKSLQNEVISVTEEKTSDTKFLLKESSVLSQKGKSSDECYISEHSTINCASSNFKMNNKRKNTDARKSSGTYSSSYSDIIQNSSSLLENSAKEVYCNKNPIISNYSNLQHKNSEILDNECDDACNKGTLGFSDDELKTLENLPHGTLQLSNRNFINVIGSTNKFSQNTNSDTISTLFGNLTAGNTLDVSEVSCKNVNEPNMQAETISTIIDSNPSHFMFNVNEKSIGFINQQQQNITYNFPLMNLDNFQSNKFVPLVEELQKSNNVDSGISINNAAESSISVPSMASIQPEKLTNSFSPIVISELLSPQKMNASENISPVECLKQKSIKSIKSKKFTSNSKSKLFNSNIDSNNICDSVQSKRFNTDESIFTNTIAQNVSQKYAEKNKAPMLHTNFKNKPRSCELQMCKKHLSDINNDSFNNQNGLKDKFIKGLQDTSTEVSFKSQLKDQVKSIATKYSEFAPNIELSKKCAKNIKFTHSSPLRCNSKSFRSNNNEGDSEDKIQKLLLNSTIKNISDSRLYISSKYPTKSFPSHFTSNSTTSNELTDNSPNNALPEISQMPFSTKTQKLQKYPKFSSDLENDFISDKLSGHESQEVLNYSDFENIHNNSSSIINSQSITNSVATTANFDNIKSYSTSNTELETRMTGHSFSDIISSPFFKTTPSKKENRLSKSQKSSMYIAEYNINPELNISNNKIHNQFSDSSSKMKLSAISERKSSDIIKKHVENCSLDSGPVSLQLIDYLKLNNIESSQNSLLEKHIIVEDSKSLSLSSPNTKEKHKTSKKKKCKKCLNTSLSQYAESQKKHKLKKKDKSKINSDSLSIPSVDFKRKHKSNVMKKYEFFSESLSIPNADSKQKHEVNKRKKSRKLPKCMLSKLSTPIKKQKSNEIEEFENHSDSEFHSVSTSDCELSDYIEISSKSQTCNSSDGNSLSMFKEGFDSDIIQTLPIVTLKTSNNSSEYQSIFKLQNNIFDKSITSNNKRNLFNECLSELENNSFDTQPLSKIYKKVSNESNFMTEKVCFPEENLSETISVFEIQNGVENESVITNEIETLFKEDSKETNKNYKKLTFSEENSPKVVCRSQNQSSIYNKFMSNSENILEDSLSNTLKYSTEIQPKVISKSIYSTEKQCLEKPTSNLSESVEKVDSEFMVNNLNETLPEELTSRTKNCNELLILSNAIKYSFDCQPPSEIQQNAFNESIISSEKESSNNLSETLERNYNESIISNLKGTLSEKYSSEISNSSKNQAKLSELVIFDENDTLLKDRFIDLSSNQYREIALCEIETNKSNNSNSHKPSFERNFSIVKNDNSTVSNHVLHETFSNKQGYVSKNVFELVDDSSLSAVNTSKNNSVILDKKRKKFSNNIHKLSKIKNIANSNTNKPSNYLSLNSVKEQETLSKLESIFKLSKSKNHHSNELQSLNSKFKVLSVDFSHIDKSQAKSHIHDSLFDTATEFIPNTQINYLPESIFKELNTTLVPNIGNNNSKHKADQTSNNHDIVRELQDTLKLIKEFINVNSQELYCKSNISVKQSQNTNTGNDLNEKLRKFHYLQHALKHFMNDQPHEESLELAENSHINLSNYENSYKIANALNSLPEMCSVLTEMPTFITSYDQNASQTFESVTDFCSTPKNFINDTQLPSFEDAFIQKVKNKNVTSEQDFIISNFDEQNQSNQKESEFNISADISCWSKSKMPQIWECNKQHSENEKSNINQEEISLYKLQTPANTNCVLKHSANNHLKSTKPLCSLNYSSNEITSKLCNSHETEKEQSEKTICQSSKKIDEPTHSYNLRRRYVYTKNCGGSCSNTS